MRIDAKDRINLAAGDEVVVRLLTAGGPVRWRGRDEWLVGIPRAWHHLAAIRRNVDCRGLNCRACERGMRRNVRFETPLLLETAERLRQVTAFLTSRDHREFAKIGEILEAEGRDPRGVRILWRRHRGGRGGEVRLLEGAGRDAPA